LLNTCIFNFKDPKGLKDLKSTTRYPLHYAHLLI